ncbi:MAG: hypothetical protein GXO30_08990 [Epsilonproteobacteria bacterium]|nr:hypothetical protein [Campylobacterota bacterium]
MSDYYVRYNIITVVPLEKSVYLYTKLPSDIKLSKNLLELNYASKSPFNKTSIFSYKKSQHLSIWFSLKEYYSSLFVIPEGFIVYFLLSDIGDGLYRLAFKENKELLVYIEDGILLVEFVISDISQVHLLEQQYKVKSKEISYVQYQDLFNSVWSNPKFLKELTNFINIELSKDKLLFFFNKYLYYPIIVTILLYIGISSYQAYNMQNTIDKLTQTYNNLKVKNSKVKNAIRIHNQDVEKFEKFIKQELYYQDPIKILASLNKVIHKGENAKIKYLSISPRYMKINIQTKE